MTEMHGLMTSPEDFQEQYVKPVAKKLNERAIYHGVTATHKVNRLRNPKLRPDTYMLIHCADSIDTLKAFYDSRKYKCHVKPLRIATRKSEIAPTASLHCNRCVSSSVNS